MLADCGSDRERFGSYFATMLAEGEAGTSVPFAQIDCATGEPVGVTTYMTLRPEHRALEIGGTWLGPSAWSTGINKEAKLLLLRHAFERVDCVRVEFKTDALNERSRRALAALPAQFEGILRRYQVTQGGRHRDSAFYSVIAEEWPAVRSALEQRLA